MTEQVLSDGLYSFTVKSMQMSPDGGMDMTLATSDGRTIVRRLPVGGILSRQVSPTDYVPREQLLPGIQVLRWSISQLGPTPLIGENDRYEVISPYCDGAEDGKDLNEAEQVLWPSNYPGYGPDLDDDEPDDGV